MCLFLIAHYNNCMRKVKVFITIVVLYEFVILTILQIPDYCNAFFNYNFCETNHFKYFLMCLMLPGLFGLFLWWLPDIARLICPNKCAVKQEKDISIKNIFNEIISKQDIEKFITAAIIMGIQKFASSHPKTTEAFDDVLDILKKEKTKKS